MANITRNQLETLSFANFPNNNSQLISPQDLRDWLKSGLDSFVTQKDQSTLENAIFESKGSPITAALTTSLSVATGNFLHIVGTNGTQIDSFGNCPAGARFILYFEISAIITYNGTSLIIPGGASITTTAGDCMMLISEGSGNWRVVGYFPGTGLPVGTVTAVTASSPISSTGGNAPNISIPQANGSTDGFLDSGDWTTFNGKQDALSAGTGISLAGNIVTNTLPDQTVGLTAGTGIGVSGTYPNFTISNTAPSSGGTVTSVSGSAPISSSGGNTPTISIPQANGSTNGFLDSGDWTTFKNKQDALSAGTGISLAGNVVTNTLPDQTVSLTPGTGIGITGTYPNFTIAATGGGGSGTVTSVGTTGLISGGPITTSGTITTSMANQKLVGRYSSGSGIMEEVSIGSGLTLTGAGVLNNTATPTPLGYYGAFSDYNNQTAAVINTGYPMTFGTTDLSNQVTVVSGSRITIANTGIYNIQWSAQFINTASSDSDVYVWLRKNGTNVVGSSGRVSIPSKHGSTNGHAIPSWNFLLDTIAGDYYEFVWSTDSLSTSIATLAAGSPQPSTASIVLTVTQQSGIMAGTGITAINSLTGSVQTLATGTSGTDFGIVSLGTSHTFNIPDASATARGFITNGNQTLAGIKTFGNGTSAGEIRLLEGSGSGVKYIAIKSPTTLSAATSFTFTLPVADGANGQVLITNGSGQLSFANNGGTLPNQYLRNYVNGQVTNTTTNTIAQSLLIPANTFSTNNGFRFEVKVDRTGNTTTFNYFAYLNTSISLSGAVALAGNAIGTGNLSAIFTRSLSITSATTTRYMYANFQTTDYVNTNAQILSSNIDWTVNQYLIVSFQPSNLASVCNCVAIDIYPI